jgi:hypothetical protein
MRAAQLTNNLDSREVGQPEIDERDVGLTMIGEV